MDNRHADPRDAASHPPSRPARQNAPRTAPPCAPSMPMHPLTPQQDRSARAPPQSHPNRPPCQLRRRSHRWRHTVHQRRTHTREARRSPDPARPLLLRWHGWARGPWRRMPMPSAPLLELSQRVGMCAGYARGRKRRPPRQWPPACWVIVPPGYAVRGPATGTGWRSRWSSSWMRRSPRPHECRWHL